jgi:hypothetical protein
MTTKNNNNKRDTTSIRHAITSAIVDSNQQTAVHQLELQIQDTNNEINIQVINTSTQNNEMNNLNTSETTTNEFDNNTTTIMDQIVPNEIRGDAITNEKEPGSIRYIYTKT